MIFRVRLSVSQPLISHHADFRRLYRFSQSNDFRIHRYLLSMSPDEMLIAHPILEKTPGSLTLPLDLRRSFPSLADITTASALGPQLGNVLSVYSVFQDFAPARMNFSVEDSWSNHKIYLRFLCREDGSS